MIALALEFLPRKVFGEIRYLEKLAGPFDLRIALGVVVLETQAAGKQRKDLIIRF